MLMATIGRDERAVVPGGAGENATLYHVTHRRCYSRGCILNPTHFSLTGLLNHDN